MRFLISFVLICLLCSWQPSYAGYMIRPHRIAALPTNAPVDSTHPKRFFSRDEAFRQGNRIPRPYRSHDNRIRRQQKRKSGNWPAIVALILVCTNYGFLAIGFAKKGMQPGRKNRKLAKVIYIISIVETCLMVLYAVLLFAALF